MLVARRMPARALKGWVAVALAFGATGLVAREAFAQAACAASTDCPKNFACVPRSTEPDGAAAESTCVSGQCQSDSDCAAGFRCLFAFGSTCTAGADGGQDCQPNNVCTPQWEVPCTASSQCGPGFTCALDGGALADPASDIVPAGFVDCGPSRFDASVPSYATATWISCSDVPEPGFCDDGEGGGATLPGCPLPICEAGTECLSVTSHSCSSPAVYQSCQSEADCPETWTCGCPETCGDIVVVASGAVVASDAGPVADAGCTTVCIPPNADLSPGYGICNGTFSGSSSSSSALGAGPSTNLAEAGSSANPANGAQPTDSVQGGCQTAPGRPSGDGAAFLVLAVVLAATRARARRT